MGTTGNSGIFDHLLEAKDFFTLREKLESHGESLSRADFLCYHAICANIFGDTAGSDLYLDELFALHASETEESVTVELLKIKADNRVRVCDYGGAADIYRLILADHGAALEENEPAEVENNFNLWNTIRDVPPQKACIDRDITMPFTRNRFNHITIEVCTDSFSGGFILDTGANLSTVSESYAREMGITVMPAGIEVATSTDIKVRTKLGVADKVRIGGILFENVVFLVVADDQLIFEELDCRIHGIIGFPVIRHMREIRIGPDTIRIPAKPVRKELGNLCLEGLMPVVRCRAGGRDLIFTLDTGANKSELSRRYYDLNEGEILEKGRYAKSRRGGGGGVVDGESYELADFELTIGSHTVVIPRISVSLAKYLFNEDKDGNLGQDVFMRFGEMTICFEYMYVDFSDPLTTYGPAG